MTEVATTKAFPYAFMLTLNAEPLAPVAQGPSLTRQRLDAAFDHIAKLDGALAGAYTNRLAASTNRLERWIIARPKTFANLGAAFGAGAVVASAGAYSLATNDYPGIGAGLVTAVVSVLAALGFGIACETGAKRLIKRRPNTAPLTSTDVRRTVELLSCLAQQDKALVKPYLDRTAAARIEADTLTPPANEALKSVMQVDPSAYPAELRAARAATLFAGVAAGERGKDAQAWLGELSALLSECSTDERCELATALIERLFANERCTVQSLTSRDANALYEVLREAQKEGE